MNESAYTVLSVLEILLIGVTALVFKLFPNIDQSERKSVKVTMTLLAGATLLLGLGLWIFEGYAFYSGHIKALLFQILFSALFLIFYFACKSKIKPCQKFRIEPKICKRFTACRVVGDADPYILFFY